MKDLLQPIPNYTTGIASNFTINGEPVALYGMIGLTTILLSYATFMGTGKDKDKESEEELEAAKREAKEEAEKEAEEAKEAAEKEEEQAKEEAKQEVEEAKAEAEKAAKENEEEGVVSPMGMIPGSTTSENNTIEPNSTAYVVG